MRTAFSWSIVLAALVALVSLGASSGCYYEVECPSCTDGGPDSGEPDGDGPDGGNPNCPVEPQDIDYTRPPAVIQGYAAPGNYATLEPGASVTLTAELPAEWAPPLECLLPIEYHWESSGGATADGTSSGPMSFAGPGFHSISLTASNSLGYEDLYPDTLYASIWNGNTFTDSFDRASLDRDTAGWSYRVSDAFIDMPKPDDWNIVDGRAHVAWTTDAYCQPASQGLLTRLEATNATVTVWQGRNTPTMGQPHYSDILLRYRFNGQGAMAPDSTFYRARVQEMTNDGADYCICLDAFKIDGEDEVGAGLNGSTVNACGNPVCGYTQNFFYVTATINGTAGSVTIDVSVDATPNPAAAFNHFQFTDASAPIVAPGRFGIGQCIGETFFDEFTLTRQP